MRHQFQPYKYLPSVQKNHFSSKHPEVVHRKIQSNSPTRINPIKEMQLIAQRSIGGDDTDEKVDDPPFNFQGMLRKTKYNRASMKRNTENKMTVFEESDSFQRPQSP